ncbi:MAG: polysaccharide biosynthesis/export family protein [Pseudomonadota bacterium]
MLRLPLNLLIALLISCLSIRPGLAEQQGDGSAAYLIQPGDVLDISVWKEEDLNKQVLVRPDGGISFPLAGDLQAARTSVSELQQQLTAKLQKYIPDPLVTVSILKLDGNKVYVIGKVNRPGEFVASRNLDVVQALSVAGGMTPYAAANKISILRRTNGKLTSIPFRYGDIEKGDNLQQNIMLQSGDVVLVP